MKTSGKLTLLGMKRRAGELGGSPGCLGALSELYSVLTRLQACYVIQVQWYVVLNANISMLTFAN